MDSVAGVRYLTRSDSVSLVLPYASSSSPHLYNKLVIMLVGADPGNINKEHIYE